ncbi:uncharacterized protein Z520_07113 [Fonsecaea multimorphosa CBS 102226]|uniref:Uncharacterized protein n=1 Tax=Fonsecaea multimorphosa CBS 102226 TaxID=1442371 RepID=A0A0D2K1X1_9EURO|nr:uncharacterized protein Z520_07113 [Fonsecaea multimorphosa CBS 102226]KIX96999.1 hypothetical protein Z520_07113 [Fonsecaea multimorphosa CBS 102226]OAL22780.1 hypothetical protein AYO22_06688 [Fonsecaea multimorphosa]
MGQNSSLPEVPPTQSQRPEETIISTLSAVDKSLSQIPGVINTAERLANVVQKAMPTVKILASHAKYLAGFQGYFIAAGAVLPAQCIQVFQGQAIIAELRGIRRELAAQTRLDAPEKFATQVHGYIDMMTKSTSTSTSSTSKSNSSMKQHLYFVYHPDTDWHPYFCKLVERKPLANNFFGMAENLDTLCIWMRYLRALFTKSGEWGKDPVFHLLMPTYRQLHIEEPIAFAQALHPLCLHGFVHNSKCSVELNLPNTDPEMLDGVGIWKRPSNLFGLFQSTETPRVLGNVPLSADDTLSPEAGIRRVRRRRRRR